MQPQPLTESLAEFEEILSDKQVQALPEVIKGNYESFERLMHFLRSYTKGLRKDEPLRQQLHTLEFVIPCELHDSEPSHRLAVNESLANFTSNMLRSMSAAHLSTLHIVHIHTLWRCQLKS